jgi:hypothetical protein
MPDQHRGQARATTGGVKKPSGASDLGIELFGDGRAVHQ